MFLVMTKCKSINKSLALVGLSAILLAGCGGPGEVSPEKGAMSDIKSGEKARVIKGVGTLAVLGDKGAFGISAIGDLLSSDDPEIAMAAVKALQSFGQKASSEASGIEDLAQKSANKPLKLAALNAVGAVISKERMVELITPMLDGDDKVQATILLASLTPGDPVPVEKLVSLVGDTNVEVRKNIATALGAVGPGSADVEKAKTALKTLSKDSDFLVAGQAKNALMILSGPN